MLLMSLQHASQLTKVFIVVEDTKHFVQKLQTLQITPTREP
jgi:hypothetical protein